MSERNMGLEDYNGNYYNNNSNDGRAHDHYLGDEQFESFNTLSGNYEEELMGSSQDVRPTHKRKYHRHTAAQIHELESFFEECPHPDEKQRKELSRQLGLEPLQIQFWFQNKRTQNRIDDRREDYNIFQHLICTGQAYGANRWVTQLKLQCERISSMRSIFLQSADSSVPTPNGKMNLLKLSVRMQRSFLDGLNISKGTPIFSGNVYLMTMKNDNDPGKPSGVILCATTSNWLPFPPHIVFDYLRDENHRIQWDVNCTSGNVQKIAQVPIGRDNRNCTTVLMNANNQMIVQETSTNPTASFVVYAPVDTASIDRVLTKDGNPDVVTILPCGFAILPDGMAQPEGNGGGGSLLTVSFQMLIDTTSPSKISASCATAENLIGTTVMKIKPLLAYQNASTTPYSGM